MANQPAAPGYGSSGARLSAQQQREPEAWELEAAQGISAAAPAAAGPRAGGCAWGWARVLVRVLVERGDPC